MLMQRGHYFGTSGFRDWYVPRLNWNLRFSNVFWIRSLSISTKSECQCIFYFLLDFICQREREREREQAQARGAAGRGRSRLPTEQGASPMWDSIPGPWDRDLSRRQNSWLTEPPRHSQILIFKPALLRSISHIHNSHISTIQFNDFSKLYWGVKTWPLIGLTIFSSSQ